MHGTGTRRRVLRRLVSAGFAGWGAAQLLRPAEVTRAVCAGRRQPPAWVTQVLGARMVGQHVAVLVRPTRAVVLTGVAVDLLHALSMVPVAVWWPAYRRPAVVSGGTSAAAAVLGAAAAARAER
ncbi:hypothetical protein O2W18_09850 [Modestobacter sp. VKM Ac-2983]|uniref:hypothetical protein n=1 Tax=Modestobacter sp. VKM Ac-2983 TaxID=3004137 RepID=UPI0022ABB286|nr:hypothetical protein [Modestobacter sp. VKM Ac-2983]MCZ2805405.1 hypothetical protein [Modestobacter sp. VKM Ac-2983]